MDADTAREKAEQLGAMIKSDERDEEKAIGLAVDLFAGLCVNIARIADASAKPGG